MTPPPSLLQGEAGRARLCGLPASLAGVIAAFLVFAVANDALIARVAGLQLYLAELLIWGVAAPLVAVSVLDRRPDAVALAGRLVPELFAYILLCGLAALLAWGFAGSMDTVGKVKNLLPGTILCVYLIYTVRDLGQIQLVFWAIVAIGGVNALLGTVQFFTGAPYIVPQLEENRWKESVSGEFLANTANGLFVTPNALGISLVPALVIGGRLALASATLPLPVRAIHLPCFAVVALGIAVSNNKGAMIWGAVGLAIACAPMRRKFALTLLATAAVTLGLILYGVASATTDQPVSTQTLLVRVLLMEAFWVNVGEHPSILLYGDGVRWMPDLAATIASWRFPTVHNTWLDQVLFFGLGAFVAFVALWTRQLHAVCRTRARTRGGPVPVADVLIGSIAALAGAVFFEPRADGIFATGQILTLLALCACLQRVVRGAETGPAFVATPVAVDRGGGGRLAVDAR